MAGDVEVDGVKCDKAGHAVPKDALIHIRPRARWVGRGAEKLLAALDQFGVSCAGRVCLDIGAGSGGFTQVMLERGASRVYAVDVGYGQFDVKLRADPRVVLIERANARTLSPKQIPEPVNFLSMDVSFISIFKVLPAIRPLMSEDAAGVILFKPNFEAKKTEVKKGGLLLDPEIHCRLLMEARQKLADERFMLVDLIPSPIRGGSGNIEYLLSVTCRQSAGIPPERIPSIVDRSFSSL